MSAETARIERKMDDMADTLNRVDKTVAVLAERGTQDREAIEDLRKRVRRLEGISGQGPRPEAPPDVTQPIPRVEPPPTQETPQQSSTDKLVDTLRENARWLIVAAMVIGGGLSADAVIEAMVAALTGPTPIEQPAPPAPAARWDMAPEAE